MRTHLILAALAALAAGCAKSTYHYVEVKPDGSRVEHKYFSTKNISADIQRQNSGSDSALSIRVVGDAASVEAARGQAWGGLGEAVAQAMVEGLVQGYFPFRTNEVNSLTERRIRLAEINANRAVDIARLSAERPVEPTSSGS